MSIILQFAVILSENKIMNHCGFVIVAISVTYTAYIAASSVDLQKNVRNNFCNNTCNNNICLGQPDNTALPNNDSCTQFFICVDGHPQPNTCPKGQWFNPIGIFCDSAENKECNPSDEFKCPAEGIFFFPHEEYCDKYIMCFAGFPILSHCADGFYFDRESLKCDRPEIAECKLEKCPINNEVFEIAFLPSDVDCEKYYICYNGNPLEQHCAPGIHWNPLTDQCDFAENVNCTIVKPDEPETPQPHEIVCDDGIYFESHPNSCEHYFVCFSGQSVMLDCAPGFYFDNKYNWCDFPEYVDCEVKNTMVKS